MKHFLFWAAFPWVIPQALWLRKTAPRFAGAGGRDHGQTGQGDAHRLLVIGDSVAAGVGADVFDNALVGQVASALSTRYACQVNWKAMGQIGATTQVIKDELLPELPTAPYDVVVVSTGVNDVTALTSIDTFRAELDSLLHQLQAHSPKAHIVVNGLPPMHQFPLLPQPLRAVIGLRSRLLDRVIQQVIKSYSRALHIPVVITPNPELFADDGYHPSKKGYVEYGRAIAEALGSVRSTGSGFSAAGENPTRDVKRVS